MQMQLDTCLQKIPETAQVYGVPHGWAGSAVHSYVSVHWRHSLPGINLCAFAVIPYAYHKCAQSGFLPGGPRLKSCRSDPDSNQLVLWAQCPLAINLLLRHVYDLQLNTSHLAGKCYVDKKS